MSNEKVWNCKISQDYHINDYIGPVWSCTVLWQVKSDKSRVTSQEWHVKSDMSKSDMSRVTSRVTSQEWHVKSDIKSNKSRVRNQEWQIKIYMSRFICQQRYFKSDMSVMSRLKC